MGCLKVYAYALEDADKDEMGKFRHINNVSTKDFNELEDALKIRSHSVATTLQSDPGIKIEIDDGWDEL